MDNPPFALSITVPVAWGEQDAFGHLNNIVYFRYFENVRMYFLERIGVLRSHDEQRIGVLLASTTCDFKQPVHWPQQLTVHTRCSSVGNTSFTLVYKITDEAGTTVAEGSSVQVMYDYAKADKVRVPKAVRQAIQALQGA